MKQAEHVPAAALGIVLDKPPEEVAPNNWTSAGNVAFMDGTTYGTGGYSRYADPIPGAAGTPVFALNVIIGSTSNWIYCTTNKVYVTDGTTHTDITPTAPLGTVEAGDWSGCILNGIPCLNNGTDVPMYWNLSLASKCAPLPGWPSTARCKALRATKYHLMALNITDGAIKYGSQVWWSNGAQAGAIPSEWVPSATNDAGDTVLGDTPGDIVDGLALRDTFIVYKNFSCYIMQYVAGTYVWTSRKLFLNTGVQALNCIVEGNGMHWLFTGTDVIRHDGQSYVSVVDEKVKKTLVQSVNPSRAKMCCVESRILNSQIWVCIPEGIQPWLTKAYVIDIKSGDIGVRLLPSIAAVCRGIVAAAAGNTYNTVVGTYDQSIRFYDQQTYSPTQDSVLMVDAVNKRLYSVDTSDLADGQPIYRFVERLSGPLGDYRKRKQVTELVPRIEGTPGNKLLITMGGQPWFGSPITWGTPQEYVIGTDHQVNDIVEGRLLSVRFEGTTSNVWKLFEYSVKQAEIGEF